MIILTNTQVVDGMHARLKVPGATTIRFWTAQRHGEWVTQCMSLPWIVVKGKTKADVKSYARIMAEKYLTNCKDARKQPELVDHAAKAPRDVEVTVVEAF